MKKHLFAAAAALAVCALATNARADYFEYSSSLTINAITGISSTLGNGTTNVTLVTNDSDVITLDGFATGGPNHENGKDGGTDIVFGQINAAVDPSTTYQDISFDFTYTLSLTDYASATGGAPLGQGSILISGQLGGSIGAGRKVNLNNLKSYATDPAHGLVDVGAPDYSYLVTLGAYSFTPPGTTFAGRFGAHVEKTSQIVPEPASWASLSIGLTGMVGLFFRRRMRRSLV